MDPIHWHDSFSVGVQKIDAQHQQLFKLVNELIRVLHDKQHAEIFDRILQEVLDYSQAHFRAEEELFKPHPKYQEHAVCHQNFVGKLLNLKQNLVGNNIEAADTLLTHLIQWLRNHILNTDIAYFAKLGYRPKETKDDLEERLRLLTYKDHVLIVDDSQVERRLLREYLQRDGYGVLEASNGAEAFQILAEHIDVHLVLTDISMPVMDGFELIRAIRNDQSLEVYLIALTDLTDKESLVKAFNLGANDFLSKPVFKPELSLRLRNGLNMLQLKSQDELIFSLAQLADCRSPETGNHLERVRQFSRLLGRQLVITCPELGVTESLATEISRFTPLHDIGKVAIADGILNKPGKLTPDEYSIMKEHARVGGELIRKRLIKHLQPRL